MLNLIGREVSVHMRDGSKFGGLFYQEDQETVLLVVGKSQGLAIMKSAIAYVDVGKTSITATAIQYELAKSRAVQEKQKELEAKAQTELIAFIKTLEAK